MRLYGYAKKDLGKGLLEMKEVTISANPSILRALAEFIKQCAEEIDKEPHRWGHEHFVLPKEVSGKRTPEFIVCNPRNR